jgi:hypothetical protein
MSPVHTVPRINRCYTSLDRGVMVLWSWLGRFQSLSVAGGGSWLRADFTWRTGSVDSPLCLIPFKQYVDFTQLIETSKWLAEVDVKKKNAGLSQQYE